MATTATKIEITAKESKRAAKLKLVRLLGTNIYLRFFKNNFGLLIGVQVKSAHLNDKHFYSQSEFSKIFDMTIAKNEFIYYSELYTSAPISNELFLKKLIYSKLLKQKVEIIETY